MACHLPYMGGGNNILYSTSPVGSILPYTVSNDLPNGYLICNGAAVLREDYPDLFARIGTVYGAGDGSTTFNLPDLRDRFIQGGETAGTVKDAGLPNITGSLDTNISNGGGTGAFATTIIQYGIVATGSVMVYTKDAFDASRCSSIYGNSTTVQPPALVMVYIIKAFQTIEYSAINPPVLNKKEVITTSGIYVAPVTGWYKFTLKGAGGGGGAGYFIANTVWISGSGGSEGGTSFAYEYMNKGDTATITIGAGGVGGVIVNGPSRTEATSGGNTSVIINNNTYTSGGGKKGATSDGRRGGFGDIYGCSSTSTSWNSVSSGAYGTCGAGNGGGASYPVNDKNGINGGGGGGGYANYNGYNTNGTWNGGDGGDGFVWIEYFNDSINT